MPTNSETSVNRTAHFLWSWRRNSNPVGEINKGLEHDATITVGRSLQTPSAVSVTHYEFRRLVKKRADRSFDDCSATEQAGRSKAAPRIGSYFPPMSFFSSFFFSSSALPLVISFFSFCSAGAGSLAKVMGTPNPTVRNAVNITKWAKRLMMKPPWLV